MVRSQVDEWHDSHGAIGTEKVTRLHFYHHETSSSNDPTVVTMAEAPTTKDSPSFFGLVGMTDNILTEGPEPTSTYLGRAQGLLAASSREEFSLVMATSFVFKGGNFSGSSLIVCLDNGFEGGIFFLSFLLCNLFGLIAGARTYCRVQNNAITKRVFVFF
ncbi:Plant disease resistance response protein [Macleaya cordata]|uniref:Dirigent protein n=1 Tax=Macleaya cordata TaxID=56857 RepID=A0A200Q731_MACCD|nr:Plant disease resistance response protein [Macleaya cordata]